MLVSIVGNIASGKTTLSRMLSDFYGWEVKYEAVNNNSYLDDYYKDMKRWSFETQIYFMNKRLNDLLDIKNHPEKTFIQDRALMEDRYTFVPTLLEQGNLDQRAYQNYCDLYDAINKLVGQPDLVIYIKSSLGNLVNQMEKRGRACESNMEISYLKSLNDKYDKLANDYAGNMIVIDGDKFKFENKPEDFEVVVQLINENLARLNKKEDQF